MKEQPKQVTAAVVAATMATEDAWRRLEEEFGLLTSAEVLVLLRPEGAESFKLDLELGARAEILHTVRRNSVYYPRFQFDERLGEVRPWVKPLLRLAKRYGLDHDDIILWLVRPTTYLGANADGTAPRPVDVVDNTARIIDVAEKAWEARQ